jgi:protein phosphatase 1D
VFPKADIWVILAEAECNRCLIIGKHGLWNVLSPSAAVAAVQEAGTTMRSKLCRSTTRHIRQVWIKPSKSVVSRAFKRWSAKGLLADNTNVVTLMLGPPGSPRAQALLGQK